ncbi:MAG TPA: DUF4097 family beta strand repeat-containing protein [Candidatus Ozemobacteraceae bacterium]|nr:DUF4097 family beta strand repeat-containing protein [Candidatus Ozemobacteraceae bacterium]
MSEARKRILNMVSEGKISVDQAEELLAALETEQKSAPQGESSSDRKKRLGDEIKSFAEQIQREVSQAMKGMNPQTQEIKDNAKKLGVWFQGMVESVTQNFSKTFASSFDGIECDFTLGEPEGFASCKTAEVSNHYGAIQIREGSAFELRVKGRLAKMAFGSQTPQDWFAANGLKVQDGTLIIGIDSFLPTKGGFDFELTIPAHLPLRCRVLSGDLNVTGNLTIERAQSVSGDLAFRQTSLRNCVIETVSGDVRVDEGVVDSDLKTSSGNLQVRRCQVHKMRAQFISGDIEVLEPKVDDATVIDILTTSGNVCIANPSGGFGKVIANTRTGTLTSGWGGISISEAGNSIRQEGLIGATLLIETISGDIGLR